MKNPSAKYVSILVLITIVSLPSINAAPFYEQILTYYAEENFTIGIYANLTYKPQRWYFDNPLRANFTLDVVLPENSRVELNITRFYVFLEFYNERVIYSLIDNPLGYFAANESRRVLNLELLLVPESQVLSHEFIIEDYNSAYLEYLVVFEGVLQEESGNTIIHSRNLYSREPEGVSWYQSPGPESPQSNADYITIRRFSLTDAVLTIAPFIVPGFFGVLAFLVIWAESTRFRVLIRREKIAGKKTYLGGNKVALAVLASYISKDLVSKCNEIVANWMREKIGIDVANDLNIELLNENDRKRFSEAEKKLWANTGEIIVSIIDSHAPGERGTQLVEHLRKRKIAPSLEDTDAFISVAEEYFTEIAARLDGTSKVHPEPEGIHRIVESTKELIYEKLEILDPHLREILEHLVEGPERESPVSWRTNGLACRTLIEGFTEALVEKIEPDIPKPKDSQTINKVHIILDWAKEIMLGHGKSEIQLLSKSLPYYQDFFEALQEIVQKTGHKPMSQIVQEESNRCVLYTFLWIADMIQLLERADFNWEE